MPNATKPTYQLIKDALLKQIRSGALRPGQLLPSEEDYAQRFSCSRLTVHRALRELAEEGFVERRRKAGTRVALAPARTARIEIPLIEQEVRSTGARYGYRLLSRKHESANEEARERLGLADGAKALHVRCLHLANATPFQFEDRWINPRVVPAALKQTFEREGPNAWLVDTMPFSHAEHVFYAANASEREAARLGIEPNDAVFVIERRTFIDGEAITWARLCYPGRYYRMHSGGAGTDNQQ